MACNYNLSVYYNRLGLERLSNQYLQAAELWQRNPNQLSLVLRAKACDASKNLNYDSAIQFLEQALALIPKMDPVDQTSLEYVAADIYFRARHESIALAILERLNFSKTIQDKARVRFELTVLRNLLSNSAQFIDGPAPESVLANQEYSLQWKILEALQSGDLGGAKQRWTELVHLLPQKFTESFKTLNPSDRNTIFMTAVDRILARPSKENTFSTSDLTGKQRALVDLLQSSEIPLRKEELIERLWKVSYDPTYDNRFYKLINRIRKDGGLKIAVVSNSYRLG